MDHLLAMPLTPFEITVANIWVNGLLITLAVRLSLYLVVRAILGVPIAGSIPLFMVGVAIYQYFATAIGIFLGTVTNAMPRLGLLFMLVYLPMNMLSGSNAPLESMLHWLGTVMQASPSTHFVSFALQRFAFSRCNDKLMPSGQYPGSQSPLLRTRATNLENIQISGDVSAGVGPCRGPQEAQTLTILSATGINLTLQNWCQASDSIPGGCLGPIAASGREVSPRFRNIALRKVDPAANRLPF